MHLAGNPHSSARTGTALTDKPIRRHQHHFISTDALSALRPHAGSDNMVQPAVPSDISPHRALRIASTAIPDPRRLSRTEFVIEAPPMPGPPNSEGCIVKASSYREAVAQRSLLLARYALSLMGLPHHDVQLGRDCTTAADLVNGQINRLAKMASGTSCLTWQADSDPAP